MKKTVNMNLKLIQQEKLYLLVKINISICNDLMITESNMQQILVNTKDSKTPLYVTYKRLECEEARRVTQTKQTYKIIRSVYPNLEDSRRKKWGYTVLTKNVGMIF